MRVVYRGIFYDTIKRKSPDYWDDTGFIKNIIKTALLFFYLFYLKTFPVKLNSNTLENNSA